MKKKFVISLLLSIIGIVLLLFWVFIKRDSIAMFDPKGIIALKQLNLMVITTILMLIVVIPVFILTVYIAWKYRAGNTSAEYKPDWDNSWLAEAAWWGFPCVIIFILSIITWNSSHELDPYKPLDHPGDPMTIQVVALQWKWLFIYPDEKIATVNYVQFPEKTPINFQITADAPMNSFWIPQLGGQIYAMPGMTTQLHLIADEPGIFRGSSANISGTGFSGMTFNAKATSMDDFKKWTEEMKKSTAGLDLKEYEQLAKPSEYNPVANYLLKKEDLFNWIAMKSMNMK